MDEEKEMRIDLDTEMTKIEILTDSEMEKIWIGVLADRSIKQAGTLSKVKMSKLRWILHGVKLTYARFGIVWRLC